MAAKKASKKVAKKAPTRPGKPRKDHTVSVRLDNDERAWLEKRAGGEAYAAEIRRLIRAEREREASQGRDPKNG